MSRPPKCRRVEYIPELTFFKPAGVPLSALNEVTVTIEEVEAIRLKDLLGLEQEECAEKMGVSRPTYHRILTAARNKIADALVNGKAIRMEGGHFQLVMKRFKCSHCQHEWEIPCGQGQRFSEMKCPQCADRDIYRINPDGTPFNCHRWQDGREKGLE
ncbi:MAG: DUF134 domain-containing protein [Bacillota bacterium]|uniref:DUF134 domain-containing protein n=1 Tax=Desulfurispora thermophila TaxID=265470 RepID=UPI00037D84AD|nr:DUF134 domain-containing protein [Desulfurispora thermophila]